LAVARTRGPPRPLTMRTMKPINPLERRSLKARAHSLNPVVIVSDAGLSESVVAEIERCLNAHELIKIRVFSIDREQRERLLAQICERTGASPIQHLGKVLVIYRQHPEPPALKPAPSTKSAKPRAPRRARLRYS
jgi:RNA-binding protein